MNSKNIIIATLFIFLVGSLLSGCTTSTKSLHESAPIQFLMNMKKVKKDVVLDLQSERIEDVINVKIVLENPSKKPISSSQIWLSYNPNHLQGNSVDTVNSPFVLTAPYDNTFDDKNGLVMIGRANNESITDPFITVAEVKFNVKTDMTAMIDTYDYRNDLSGHVSANMMLDGKPYNVLLKPESPLLIIKK